MLFGIILIVIGATLLLKALGLLGTFQWDYVFAIIMLAVGFIMIWKRSK